jgi:ribosomal protein S12 methylthiotransferase
VDVVAERYWIETLGCPKNQVDSDKLVGALLAEGLDPAGSPNQADLVVVNTCAFIEAARQESIGAILELDAARRTGSRLVVTGCLAERYGGELEDALPEVDLVAPFGTSLTSGATSRVELGRRRDGTGSEPGDRLPDFDLLNLPRPAATAPWAYVKVAEGCDRRCGFCAIPSFRGAQRSRAQASILAEVDNLCTGPIGLREAVLVAQDLASFGLDHSDRGLPRDPELLLRRSGRRPIVDLVSEVSRRVPWTRLLYLYPSALDEGLIEAVLGTGVPYFDLSLQHVSRPLLRRMRRWGEGERFLEKIRSIRAVEPNAAFRSSFIVGYPGETESDHDQLLEWIAEAGLDWVGVFPFSREAGTFADGLEGEVPAQLVAERIDECTELQDAITRRKQESLIGRVVEVLVDSVGQGRTVREAPEIDGTVTVPNDLPVGTFVELTVVGADGPDLFAERSDRLPPQEHFVEASRVGR